MTHKALSISAVFQVTWGKLKRIDCKWQRAVLRTLFLACLMMSQLFQTPAAFALPPFEHLMRQVESVRTGLGSLTGQGLLTYGLYREVPVEMIREWGEPVRISLPESEMVFSHQMDGIDVVLRLAGVVLSGRDLIEALSLFGWSFEEAVQTLDFIDGRIVYVVGAQLQSNGVRIYIDRESYQIYRIDMPMPEGLYQLEMSEYLLVGGWFPQEIRVSRGDSPIFRLTMGEIQLQ